MNKYIMYCIVKARYDIIFIIEAETDVKALKQAAAQLEADGIADYTNLCIQDVAEGRRQA